MNHVKVIEYVVTHTKYDSYLELGVADGANVAAIAKHVSKCHCVDMIDNRNIKAGTFFQMSTDDYFKQTTETFDVIFIDANHDIDYATRDLENSLKILNPGGVIFMHDTDPESMDLTQSRFCSDSYKINEYDRQDLDIVTLPIDNNGLTIIKRRNECRYNTWI